MTPNEGEVPRAPVGTPAEGQDASPGGDVPVSDTPTMTVPETGRPVLQNIRRQIDDPDLLHPGVIRMVIDRMDVAENQCKKLEQYVEKYYRAHEDAAVLRTKLEKKRAFEILCDGGFALGGILLGCTPSLWTNSGGTAIVIGAVGASMIVASLIARRSGGTK
jgi:hypothetical protein